MPNSSAILSTGRVRKYEKARKNSRPKNASTMTRKIESSTTLTAVMFHDSGMIDVGTMPSRKKVA